MIRRAALLAGLATAVLPATAGAHSIVRVNSGVVTYISSDAVSLNQLQVSNSGANIRLYDPDVSGGIDPGTSCTPGQTNSRQEVVEVFCPRAGVNQVRVEIGEREDSMTSTVDVPILALGGNGADTLSSGALGDLLVGNEGNDTVDGGAGNDQLNGSEGDDTLRGGVGDDVLQAGPGADDVDGGPGSDEVRAHDGVADRVRCGDGVDKVDADTIDDVAPDCESVTRASTPPPGADGTGDGSGGGSPGSGGGSSDGGSSATLRDDKTAPRLRVGGSTSQRLRGSRKIVVLATSSERGTVAASGFLDIAGLQLPLKSRPSDVRTAGGGAKITIRLSRGQYRKARRALRKKRRVSIVLGVVATDAAGNSSATQAPRIRLRR